jgi:hypothetical protein
MSAFVSQRILHSHRPAAVEVAWGCRPTCPSDRRLPRASRRSLVHCCLAESRRCAGSLAAPRVPSLRCHSARCPSLRCSCQNPRRPSLRCQSARCPSLRYRCQNPRRPSLRCQSMRWLVAAHGPSRCWRCRRCCRRCCSCRCHRCACRSRCRARIGLRSSSTCG